MNTTTTISGVLATERAADLRRAAAGPSVSCNLSEDQASRVELRLADHDDLAVVRRIAALDDARELEGPVLLASVDGEAVAALALRDRRVVANPFVRTEQPVALLRLRADHLYGVTARRRRIRRPRLRLA
ncbi:MAG: hypothetical protein WBQ18_00810 [Solirubrobacteraceae bacterium]